MIHQAIDDYNSSFHNIIFNVFRIVLVLWSLLVQTELSPSYVIVVQKSTGPALNGSLNNGQPFQYL